MLFWLTFLTNLGGWISFCLPAGTLHSYLLDWRSKESFFEDHKGLFHWPFAQLLPFDAGFAHGDWLANTWLLTSKKVDYHSYASELDLTRSDHWPMVPDMQHKSYLLKAHVNALPKSILINIRSAKLVGPPGEMLERILIALNVCVYKSSTFLPLFSNNKHVFLRHFF